MTKLARKHQQGFTLIELLITVSIIAVLTVVGVASFLNAQRKGRDARRKADLVAIQQSMENYFSNNNAYPATAAIAATAMANGILPVDPSGVAYAASGVAATAYCYCTPAVLEVTGGTGNASNSTCTFATGATATYQCVKQQQI